MSWEPAWVPDGRGGFVRKQRNHGDGEEGEEAGDHRKSEIGSTSSSNAMNNMGIGGNVPPSSRKHYDDDEEEGEISTPTGGGGLHRKSSMSGHNDFRGPSGPHPSRFGGGRGSGPPGNGPNRPPPFGGGGTRHRHHSGSFTNSNMQGGPVQGNGGMPGGGPPFKREGGFGGRGAGGGFGPSRGMGGDFRNEPSGRSDFGDGRKDFRGDGPPPPQGRNFPPNRDFREDGPNRDFRGEKMPFRAQQGGDGPPNRGDFRDRKDGLPTTRSEYRGGPSDGGPRDGPNFGGQIIRESSSFGSHGPRPFRDGPHPRDGPSFRSNVDRGRSGAISGPSGFGGGREMKREPSFGMAGPRGDIGGTSRDQVSLNRGSGPPPFGQRGGGPPNREGGPPPPMQGNFHRVDSNRETSFSDLAGPPRDRPFRDDGSQPRRSSGGGPPGSMQGGFPPSNSQMQGNPPMDPRRPTDPRRRSLHDQAGMGSNVSHLGKEVLSGSSDGHRGPPIPSPQSGRRIGSYSSLADSSSIPPTLVPSQSLQGHDGTSSFRSPAGRRPTIDSSQRGDRGDSFGNGGVSQQQRHGWSPGNERRLMGGSPRSLSLSGKSMGYQQQQQQKQFGGPDMPPVAPSLISRQPPGNFRDPRFKGMEKAGGDLRPDFNSSTSMQNQRFDGSSKKKPFASNADISSGLVGSSAPKMESYGKPRDFVDRQFGKSPRSSPSKQRAIKSFPPSPRSDSGKAAFATTAPLLERANSGSSQEAAISVSDGQQGKGQTRQSIVLAPLLTSSLGDDDIIKRAEKAVLHLSEVVKNPSLKASGDSLSKLPQKRDIMEAMNQIEKLIKEANRDVEGLEEEKKTSMMIEEEEARFEEKRLEEEENRRALEREEQQKEAEKQHEEEKSQARRLVMESSEVQLEKARKKLQHEFEEQIVQAKEEEKRRCFDDLEDQMSIAQVDYDKEINKAKNSIEKAKAQIVKVESKISQTENEYQSLLDNIEKEVKRKQQEAGDGGAPPKLPELVQNILGENKRRANEAQICALSMPSENENASTEAMLRRSEAEPRDPLYGKTYEEWSVLAKQVTGLADALYSEPTEAPYFLHNERTHELVGPCVKEYIKDTNQRLLEHWTELAEEYEVRTRLYEKQQRRLAKKSRRGSSVMRQPIFAGVKESTGPGIGIDKVNIVESGGRASNNPYRRARRGNEVRSEYEQEQIIAEIAAKEAMEKRITHGGCKVPRQDTRLERSLTAAFANTFLQKRVDDPKLEAEEEALKNIWTDMEKCIFLDRFLQFPKDFRRIASFLKNKNTKDCVAFYYDSKQTVPYKGALKEHTMRRKRKGDYQIWDASIQAALSVGAKVTAGSSEEKPVEFSLPESDRTYRTFMLHPLRRSVLDRINIDEELTDEHERESRSEEAKWKSRKRGRDPLFFLDKQHTKFLRMASQESMSLSKIARASGGENRKSSGQESEVITENNLPTTPVRKAPQKWTASEKKIFIETFEQHGRDWIKLAKAVGTKNEKQIKNFYYDWKKGKARANSEKKAGKKEKSSKSTEKSRKEASQPIRDVTPSKDEAASGTSAQTVGEEDRPPAPSSSDHLVQDDLADGNLAITELRAHGDTAIAREQKVALAAAVLQRTEGSEKAPLEANGEFGATNQDLMRQLINRQLQHQHGQPIQLSQSLPQSAIQQLLNQQQLQREQQQHQRMNQISLEESRRLLDHQNQQRGSVLSNLMSSPWLATSQMLQAQAGLGTHPIAASLRSDNGSLGGISEINDLQRLLHLQQATQGIGLSNRASPLASMLLGGGGLASNPGIPGGLLSQLEGINNSNAAQASDPGEHLSSLANAQTLLGYSGSNGANSALANALYRQSGTGALESAGVSDALSLLARSMQRGGEGASHGFGRPTDKTDEAERYS